MVIKTLTVQQSNPEILVRGFSDDVDLDFIVEQAEFNGVLDQLRKTEHGKYKMRVFPRDKPTVEVHDIQNSSAYHSGFFVADPDTLTVHDELIRARDYIAKYLAPRLPDIKLPFYKIIPQLDLMSSTDSTADAIVTLSLKKMGEIPVRLMIYSMGTKNCGGIDDYGFQAKTVYETIFLNIGQLDHILDSRPEKRAKFHACYLNAIRNIGSQLLHMLFTNISESKSWFINADTSPKPMCANEKPSSDPLYVSEPYERIFLHNADEVRGLIDDVIQHPDSHFSEFRRSFYLSDLPRYK